MLKLRRRFHPKRRLRSTSSSTAGSVSDLEDRVIMTCEDVPDESSFGSSWGPRDGSSQGSQRTALEAALIHLSSGDQQDVHDV